MTERDEEPVAEREPEPEREAEPSKRTSAKKKRPIPGAVPSRFRGVWIALAALYLVTVWLDGVGSTWPAKVTPRPWLYFSQVAALFVNAAPKVIDYRAEGWSCTERRWVEIDVRPYFRIDADNKENRFQRALQFYRKNRNVMRALEDFVVARHTASGHSIGGIRFSSLRIAYPAPGEHVSPFERRALSSYTGDQKHAWYWTPQARRVERCGNEASGGDHDDDSDRSREQAPSKDDSSRDLDP